MRKVHEKDRSWECLFGWTRAEFLTLKPRGLPLSEWNSSHQGLGPICSGMKTSDSQAQPRLSEPGSPELGPGSCIIVAVVSTGSPGDPNILLSLRFNTAGTAGMGRSQEAEMDAANRSLSIHVPNFAWEGCGRGDRENDKIQAKPSAKSTKEAAFPKVGSQECQASKSLSE